MSGSILQSEKVCWLCGANNPSDPLELHHVYGGSARRISDKYGLTVWLCGNSCHRLGKYAVHQNAETRMELQSWSQHEAMKKLNWSIDEWMLHMKKNYI